MWRGSEWNSEGPLHVYLQMWWLLSGWTARMNAAWWHPARQNGRAHWWSLLISADNSFRWANKLLSAGRQRSRHLSEISQDSASLEVIFPSFPADQPVQQRSKPLSLGFWGVRIIGSKGDGANPPPSIKDDSAINDNTCRKFSQLQTLAPACKYLAEPDSGDGAASEMD